MIPTLFLHGVLGKKFNRQWNFAVKTPAEMIKAICRFRKDFAEFMFTAEQRGTRFRVVIDGKEGSFFQLLHCNLNSEVHLYPVPAGAKSAGVQILIGAVILISAVASGGGSLALASTWSTAFTAGGFTQFFAYMGAAMIFGGISQLIANPTGVNPSSSNADNKRSYLFSGAQGTTQQGVAIPVGYGRLHIGTIPVSAGMFAERIELPENVGADTDGDGIPDDFNGDGIPDNAQA